MVTLRWKGRPISTRWMLVVAVLGLVGIGGLIIARPKKKAIAEVPVATVDREDIVVTVEANGAIEPINVVEVKSKASGQIVQMPVEIGSQVRSGQLLAQIDPRDVRNQYNQNRAALQAAKVQSDVAAAQKKRSDQLFQEQVITAQEHDAAVLEYENARARLVGARTDLDLARQRLEDATVRAPVAGTVIEKPVSVGQVISSATSSVSGGTTLLKMADLKKIRLRTLVNETDIGNVRPGQPATVVVDAYPDRQFRGSVEKVEPMATVEQSVTMFPVLVSISNEEGLLMPGMNGEVTILVDRRDDVVAVPVDAVRNFRDAAEAAPALGLKSEDLRTQLRAQARARTGADGARSGALGGGADSASTGRSGRWSRGGAGAPEGTAGRDSLRGRRSRAWRDGTARAGESGGWGGRGGSGGASSRGGSSEAGSAGGTGVTGGPGGQRGGGAQSARVVFVKTGTGFTPRLVRLGVSNYDMAQVLSGLQEGEQVALVSAAQLQYQRQENVSRMRQRMGSALPGVGGTGGGARQQQQRSGGGTRQGGGM